MTGKVLVYGGKGALGCAMVDFFKNKGWWVCSVDIASNPVASINITVDPKADWKRQNELIIADLQAKIGSGKLDAVVCVAGGWAGGNAASGDFIANCDLMCKQSVWTSCIAAAIAAKHLKTGGVLLLTGAKAAQEATPGMIGYGMMKAAVHHLAASLSKFDGGLPPNSVVLAILPVTLDTPMNRKFMPDADFSTWTPLSFVADLVFKWTTEPLSRPGSGTLVKLVTEKSITRCEV